MDENQGFDPHGMQILVLLAKLAVAERVMAAADHLANRYSLDCEPPLAIDDPVPAYDEARKEYLHSSK